MSDGQLHPTVVGQLHRHISDLRIHFDISYMEKLTHFIQWLVLNLPHYLVHPCDIYSYIKYIKKDYAGQEYKG